MDIPQNTERVRRWFHELAARDKRRAADYLNGDNLGFPTLFLLMPEIASLDLYDSLNPRNKTALGLCAKKGGGAALAVRFDRTAGAGAENERAALRWMLLTGYQWDGPHEQYDPYDAAIDAAASILLLTYKDASILPHVCALIFRRNREGLLVHDLAWSFFRLCEVRALELTANYLLSDHPKDVELACRLLHLPAPRDPRNPRERGELYRNYHTWLRENGPYLYFTGEHFLETAEPEPVRVNTEARYLCKKVSARKGVPLEPLTDEERGRLKRFRETPAGEREELSAASARLHERSLRQWNEWMGKEAREQLSSLRGTGR